MAWRYSSRQIGDKVDTSWAAGWPQGHRCASCTREPYRAAFSRADPHAAGSSFGQEPAVIALSHTVGEQKSDSPVAPSCLFTDRVLLFGMSCHLACPTASSTGVRRSVLSMCIVVTVWQQWRWFGVASHLCIQPHPFEARRHNPKSGVIAGNHHRRCAFMHQSAV